jgi:hypothetical protein
MDSLTSVQRFRIEWVMNEAIAPFQRQALARFFRQYRSARPQDDISSAALRLACFFSNLRQMRTASCNRIEILYRPVDVPASEKLFARLRETRQRALKAGTFGNVWEIAGLGRNEVRTASVLAWMLDHRQTHGFGHAVLSALLQCLGDRLWEGTERLDFGDNYFVHTEFCALGGRDNRIDIVIEGTKYVLFIEVKIDAPEGDGQLKRYCEMALRKAHAAGKPFAKVLYLSEHIPEGLPPEVVRLRWRDVARAIRVTLRKATTEQSFPARLLSQFADHIERLH